MPAIASDEYCYRLRRKAVARPLRRQVTATDEKRKRCADSTMLLQCAFLCKIKLRARASGIELDSRLGQVFWVERGLIVREHDYSDWDEALRAAGIPPEPVATSRSQPSSKS